MAPKKGQRLMQASAEPATNASNPSLSMGTSNNDWNNKVQVWLAAILAHFDGIKDARPITVEQGGTSVT